MTLKRIKETNDLIDALRASIREKGELLGQVIDKNIDLEEKIARVKVEASELQEAIDLIVIALSNSPAGYTKEGHRTLILMGKFMRTIDLLTRPVFEDTREGEAKSTKED